MWFYYKRIKRFAFWFAISETSRNAKFLRLNRKRFDQFRTNHIWLNRVHFVIKLLNQVRIAQV